MVRKISIFLLGYLLVTSSCTQFTKMEKSKNYDQKLKYANELYDQKRYGQAQELYEEMMPIFKGTVKAEDLLYRYAYTFYYEGDYTSGAFWFKNFVEAYPNSPHADELDYMQAYSFFKLSPRVELDQSNTIKAMDAMQEFINTHPNSKKLAEASHIIDLCRRKLEDKEYRGAQLYYNIGLYKASGIAFTSLMQDYPDSELGDKYKLMIIKSYFQYAKNSIEIKQQVRFNRVVHQYHDFLDNYPKSTLTKEAEKYYSLSLNELKSLQNEQSKEKSNQ